MNKLPFTKEGTRVLASTGGTFLKCIVVVVGRNISAGQETGCETAHGPFVPEFMCE